MNRIESLDWLRAFMAIVIMIYHYIGWVFGSTDPSSTIWVFGIYGVSIFFILSGLSLSIGYHLKLNNTREILDFVVKRLFRILPLMWLVTGCSILVNGVESYSTSAIVMNLTATFGFLDPSSYIATGTWSIGNEMVFYALFPLFIIAFRKSLKLGNILVVITIGIETLYVIFVLSNYSSLGQGWSAYIHPINNLFLFALGIALYFNFRDSKISDKTVAFFLGLAAMIFVLPNACADQIEIVLGMNRVLLSIASVFFVFGFYKMHLRNINKHFESVMNFLGQMSYSVYLLHPVIFSATLALLTALGVENKISLFIIPFVLTFIISGMVYEFFEKPFVKLGRYVSKKFILKKS